VAATKFNAIEISLEVGSKIFELTGVRSSLAQNGFDRFWRNMRGMVQKSQMRENADTDVLQFIASMIHLRIK